MSPEMNTVEQVKQCRTPQEALLLLAAAIDALIESPVAADPWHQALEWPDDLDVEDAPDNRAVIQNGDVIVKPVSQERQVSRRYLARSQRLHEFYGTSLSAQDFQDAYVKGGPRWLYYTNRECVMQMPRSLRTALVDDILLDSPAEADEIGRDILKIDESVPEGSQVEYAKRELGPVGG